MRRRSLVAALCCALVMLMSAPMAANAGDRRAAVAGRVKTKLEALGTGESAHVDVRLADGRQLSGSVAELRDDEFVVIDAATGAPTTVQYGNVGKVKGNNLNTGVKIAITFLVTMAIGIGIAALLLSADDS